jgi:hypothetical protein
MYERGEHADPELPRRCYRVSDRRRSTLSSAMTSQISCGSRIGLEPEMAGVCRLRQAIHQLESLLAQRPQLLEPRDVATKRNPRRRSSRISSTTTSTRAVATSGRRYARRSRTNNASDTRARFVPSPTCSALEGGTPSAQQRSCRHRPGRPRRPAAGCRAPHRRARAARRHRRPL